jgi:cytosine deaminase
VSPSSTFDASLFPSAGRQAPRALIGVTLLDGRVVDVGLSDGRITSIEDTGLNAGGDDGVLRLEGFLLLPSLVEPHAHLDKALTADALDNPDGSLLGAIEAWLPARAGFKRSDIAARAWAVVYRYLAHGAATIRAHVDTGEDIGLRAIEAILAVRGALGGTVDLEIVAGCSRPVTGGAGAANRAVLIDALAAGADLVGGPTWSAVPRR